MIRKNIEFANGEDFMNRKIRVVRDCKYDIDDQNIVVKHISNANGEVYNKKYDIGKEILGYY